MRGATITKKLVDAYLVQKGRIAEMSAVVLMHRVAGVHVGSVFGIANHGQHHNGIFVPTNDGLAAFALVCNTVFCHDGSR